MTKSAKGKTRIKRVVEREDFQRLLDVLAEKGYRLVGPTVRDGSVIYDDIQTVSDFPIGYSDEQEKGTYRLHKTDEPKLFAYTLGPHSWKKYLYPSAVRLWQASRNENGFDIQPETYVPERLALIGVRACELHAIAIQDRVFTDGAYVDPTYQATARKYFCRGCKLWAGGQNVLLRFYEQRPTGHLRL